MTGSNKYLLKASYSITKVVTKYLLRDKYKYKTEQNYRDEYKYKTVLLASFCWVVWLGLYILWRQKLTHIFPQVLRMSL